MSPRDATQPTLEVSRREIWSAATKVERGMHAPRVRKDIGSGGIGGGSGIGSGSRILLSAWITLAGVLPAGRALAAAARAPVENARRTAAPGHTVAQRVSISRRTEDLQPMALRVTPLGSCHTSRGRLRRESTQGTEQRQYARWKSGCDCARTLGKAGDRAQEGARKRHRCCF